MAVLAVLAVLAVRYIHLIYESIFTVHNIRTDVYYYYVTLIFYI